MFMHLGRFLSAVLLLLGAWSAQAKEPPVRTDIEDAKVVVDESGAIVVIHSPGGIGRGTLRRTGDAWPDRLTVRIDLRGMEGFTAQAGDLVAQTFLGSQEPEVNRIGKDQKRTPVQENAEQYSPVVKRLGEQKIEVLLPPALLRGASEVKIHWVDFYR
ncbi:MAG: hypothetical protein KDA84_27520 [Planctomycetaceae bacterium]|nr:hypothetical protein [Planctomycetaceae bacterium]